MAIRSTTKYAVTHHIDMASVEPLQADSEHPIELIVASRISPWVTWDGPNVSLTNHGAQYMKLMRFVFSEMTCLVTANPMPPAEDAMTSLFTAPGAVLSSKARFAELGLRAPMTFKIARKVYRALLAAMEEYSAADASLGMPAFVLLKSCHRLKGK